MLCLIVSDPTCLERQLAEPQGWHCRPPQEDPLFTPRLQDCVQVKGKSAVQKPLALKSTSFLSTGKNGRTLNF